ncbi:MAG: hypothetical protein ACP5OC_08225 [Thermoplasmata archaeon]
MTPIEELQLLTAFGTILLAIAAFVAIFFPKIDAHFRRPNFEIQLELKDEGRNGLSFIITNKGKSPSHNTVATLRILKSGRDLVGQWNPPWKLFSSGFPGVSNGLIEATYVGITIYPGQSVELFAFEKIYGAPDAPLMGLNAPPYLKGFGTWPPVFWAINKLPPNVTAPLSPEEKYVVTMSLFCEELQKRVSASFNIKWDQEKSAVTLLK